MSTRSQAWDIINQAVVELVKKIELLTTSVSELKEEIGEQKQQINLQNTSIAKLCAKVVSLEAAGRTLPLQGPETVEPPTTSADIPPKNKSNKNKKKGKELL